MYYTFDGSELVRDNGDMFGRWEPTVLRTGQSYSYGDFHEFKGQVTDDLKKTLFVFPELMEGSDYSNGIIHKSNHRVFLEKFKEVPGVYDVWGGYSTYAIAIQADVAESHVEIKEVLSRLEDYPVIDSEDVSLIEHEQEEAAMPDLLKDIRGAINLEDEFSIDELSIDVDSLLKDDKVLENMVWEGIDSLNMSWSYENTGAYLDSEEITPYIIDRILLDHCKDFPLLINHEWSCKDTKASFEMKLKGEVA